MRPLSVLLIEDRASDATLLLHELRRAGFMPNWRRVETEIEYLAYLDPALDLILADYTLPQFGASRALELLLDRGLDIPFIIVSGTIVEEVAVGAVRQGATDYLFKDRLARLEAAVTQALEQRRLRREKGRIEAALIEKAALNQAVLRSLSARIAVLDKAGVIIAVNDAWVQHRQSSHSSAAPLVTVGANYLELCRHASEHSSPNMAVMLAGLQDVLNGTQQHFSFEYADALPPEERWVAVHITPLRGLGGAVVAYEDVTERKHLEAQYLQAQKMESIGRLAGGIAHDFNNLLTAITGYAELGLLALPDAEAMRGNLDQIVHVAMRASTLTRQLLAFTRQQIVEPQLLDLNDLIMDMGQLLQRLIGEDIELAMQPALDLGLIRADPGQIEQVLANLVVNARDAMPGGGTMVIETASAYLGADCVRQPGDYAMLAVRDTGAGMDDLVKQRAFEPFFTTKQPGLGTGLGLATCYEIVRQNGGHIQLESAVDQGTTVMVFLPYVEDAAREVPSQREKGPATLPQGTETVLLVEDDPAVRSVAAQILRECGYIVLEASNGDDALSIMHTRAGQLPDLLLVDVVMPQIDGRVLADQMRALHPGIRVLFMSGYMANLALQHGWLPHSFEFLQKPFSAQVLAQKVRSILETPRV